MNDQFELIEELRSKIDRLTGDNLTWSKLHKDLSEQYYKLEKEFDDWKAPRPISRLEIAAIMLSGAFRSTGNFDNLAKAALKQTDALIAAAKEGQ